jgi:hypothetical protein
MMKGGGGWRWAGSGWRVRHEGGVAGEGGAALAQLPGRSSSGHKAWTRMQRVEQDT